jgi:hypothetical protein
MNSRVPPYWKGTRSSISIHKIKSPIQWALPENTVPKTRCGKTYSENKRCASARGEQIQPLIRRKFPPLPVIDGTSVKHTATKARTKCNKSWILWDQCNKQARRVNIVQFSSLNGISVPECVECARDDLCDGFTIADRQAMVFSKHICGSLKRMWDQAPWREAVCENVPGTNV